MSPGCFLPPWVFFCFLPHSLWLLQDPVIISNLIFGLSECFKASCSFTVYLGTGNTIIHDDASENNRLVNICPVDPNWLRGYLKRESFRLRHDALKSFEPLTMCVRRV